MNDFKVGDRVAVYSGKRIVGVITEVHAEEYFCGPIAVKYEKGVVFVHPKQCRKLVKKPRRRIWMAGSHKIGHAIDWTGCFSLEPKEGYTEFVEVKRK